MYMFAVLIDVCCVWEQPAAPEQQRLDAAIGFLRDHTEIREVGSKFTYSTFNRYVYNLVTGINFII